MPFVERNRKKERKIIKELLKKPDVRKSHDNFEKDFYFRLSLVQARKQSNLSQIDLAKKTGLSQQAISRIETGYSNATIGSIFKYLEALNAELRVVKAKQ